MPGEREQYPKDTDCLLCCLNFCLGLSNVARFPYLVYNNGGAAVVFVAVYLLLLFSVGVPMLFLEIFLGQFTSYSVPRAFEGFPMAKGLGWAMLCGSLMLTVTQIPIVSHCVIYVAASILPEQPWTTCDQHGVVAHGCYINKPGTYPCSKINDTLARRYMSSNYSEGVAIVVSGSESSEPVSVPIREYEALRNTCINGTSSAARTFYEHQVELKHPVSTDVAEPSVKLPVAMAVTWALTSTAVGFGIQSLRKISVVMLNLRLTLMALLCVASCTLSGARQGILVFLRPDFSRVIAVKTWSTASTHMFYSVGLSTGTVIFLGSYRRVDSRILGSQSLSYRDNIRFGQQMKQAVTLTLYITSTIPTLLSTVVKVAGLDLAFSVFAGVFVFGLYGHLADVFHVDIFDVATSGPDYLFVSFLETTEPLPYPRVWSLTFYVMITAAALGPQVVLRRILVVAAALSFASPLIDTQVCTFGTVVWTMADLIPTLSESRTLWAFVSCTAGFGITLPLALREFGFPIRNFVANVVYPDLMPWIAFAEIIIMAYAYGADRLAEDVYFIFNQDLPAFIKLSWRFICPTVLAIIGVIAVVTRTRTETGTAEGLPWATSVEIAVFVSVIVIFGAFVLHSLAANRYDLYAAMQPQPGYGPKDLDLYCKYVTFLTSRNALSRDELHAAAKVRGNVCITACRFRKATVSSGGVSLRNLLHAAGPVERRKSSPEKNKWRSAASSPSIAKTYIAAAEPSSPVERSKCSPKEEVLRESASSTSIARTTVAATELTMAPSVSVHTRSFEQLHCETLTTPVVTTAPDRNAAVTVQQFNDSTYTGDTKAAVAKGSRSRKCK